MALSKKFNKKKRELHAAKLLAMQNTIRLTAEKAVEVSFLTMLPEVKKEIADITFEGIGFLTEKLASGINKEKELFDILSSIYYSEGEEDPILHSQENFDKFMLAVKEYITIDKIKEVYETYDQKKYKFDKIAEGVRIINSAATGEEHEVIQ